MKIDLVGPEQRGLAMGFNEAAGYGAVALTALATGVIAETWGLRPAPFLLGVAFVALGIGLSTALVRETRAHAALEAAAHTGPGKTASCAAMALTFGAYAWPEQRRLLAVLAVVALTAVNYQGVRKTAALTKAIVVVVLLALAVVVVAALGGGRAGVDNIGSIASGGWRGILESAGLLFFAFAGYARIATLGEEVRDPARTIPRAVPIALGITLVVYATVAATALVAVGPEVLASAAAPLDAVVAAGSLDALRPVVRLGGTVAALGVLLSLIVGVSRTAFAMASRGEMPRALDAVHPVHQVPHHAELAVGAVVAVVVSLVDLRGAIGFSSFAVLVYYAIANASAWTLPPHQRRWPRPVAVTGVVGCVVLAATLPVASVVSGATVLAVGALVWLLRRSRVAAT